MRAFSGKLHEVVRLRLHAEHLAFYDELTCLPNRRLLLERIKFALEHSARKKRPLAVMFLDLDHFKQINDRYGHDVGDLLLQRFSQRLSEVTRQSDTVARLSGDEFVIVLENLAENSDQARHAITQFSDKLLLRLQMPYDLDVGHVHQLYPSVGVAISNHPENNNAQILLKNADAAMYQAKQAGGNALQVYGERAGQQRDATRSNDLTNE